MRQRIVRAYRLDEPQEEAVQEVFERFSAAYRESMGDQFQEMVDLRRKMRERLREYGDEFQRERKGEEPTGPKLPPWREDPVLTTVEDRRQEIDHDHPYDWNAVLDGIDEVLPKELAERGRERLAEQYPHGFSADEDRKVSSGKQKEGGDEAALDRWRAYLKKFGARHELTGGQATAAKSILDEVRERAARMTQTMRDETARYRADDDAKSGKLVAEAFQFDIDDLFDEFTARLDAILTTVQRDK